MDFLKGNRTYLLAIAALITVAASLFGTIDEQTANILLTIFGFGGMITLRAAVK